MPRRKPTPQLVPDQMVELLTELAKAEREWTHSQIVRPQRRFPPTFDRYQQPTAESNVEAKRVFELGRSIEMAAQARVADVRNSIGALTSDWTGLAVRTGVDEVPMVRLVLSWNARTITLPGLIEPARVAAETLRLRTSKDASFHNKASGRKRRDTDPEVAAVHAKLSTDHFTILKKLHERRCTVRADHSPTGEEITKWLGWTYNGNLKTRLGRMRTHGVLGNKKGTGKLGGYYITPLGRRVHMFQQKHIKPNRSVYAR